MSGCVMGNQDHIGDTDKMVGFDDYQAMAQSVAVYPGRYGVMGVVYTALGMNGEAGEVAEKIKKILRDKNGAFDAESRAAILKELGDVLWYVTMCADELGFTLADVAQGNADKLLSRKNRGVLGGSGDNR